jgi:hypothetical protein
VKENRNLNSSKQITETKNNYQQSQNTNSNQLKNNNQPITNFTHKRNMNNKSSNDNQHEYKSPIPRYYSKNVGQITIKADKDLVDSIKQIAKDEERTIQTVTNRLLEKALDLYEKEREYYLK